MSDREAGDRSSVVVARGKIKVDARRAIAKLRDHLLVDLHLYTTEIARVAVAMGATALDVTWDADDVALTWAGRPLDIEAVARARDHVLAPETHLADGDALRVLGIGVSAALGLDPAFVDVYSVDAAQCARVRFDAKHLDEDACAAAPEPRVVATPSDMPKNGMRVHVHKRLGLSTLGHALRQDIPREVQLLVDATHDTPLVITVNGALPAREARPTVLLRIDLDEPSATRALLEVLDPQQTRAPSTVFLDLGVQLARIEGLGLEAPHHLGLPMRVVLDARKLPTNASRSEVRMDGELLQRVRARVAAAVDAALAALEAVALRGESPTTMKTGHSVSVVDARRELHGDALGAIAAHVCLVTRGGGVVNAAAQRLLSLPLLRNAVGDPMTLAELGPGAKEQPLLVYASSTPAPRELASFLNGVVWQCGLRAERVFRSLVVASANERVALASEGRERQRRALEHPPSKPVLPASSGYVLKEAFAVSSGAFGGLTGEIAIVKREGGYRRSSTVRIFVDERMLESMPLPGVSLPVDMALGWPGTFRARVSYDGVERDERLTQAIVYALRVAAMAVGERLGVHDIELARLAIFAHASATQTLDETAGPRHALGKLAQQAVWEAADGSLVALATIDAYANRTGALCTAPPGSGGAVDGRPVIVTEQAKLLLPLLRNGVRLIDYAPALARGPRAADEALALQALASPVRVEIARKNIRGFVGIGPNRKRIFHAGVLVRDEPSVYRNGPILCALEDLAAVADGSTLLWSSLDLGNTGHEEDALLQAVLGAVEAGAIDVAVVEEYLAIAKRKVAERAKAKRPHDDHEWMTAILERLEELPKRLERERLATAKRAVLAREARPRITEDAADTLVTKAGAVRATPLPADAAPPPAEISFEGRLIESVVLTSLPLAFVFDVTREDYFTEWRTLSPAGQQWAKDSAFVMAAKIVDARVGDDDFANDPQLLRLADALLAEPDERTARIAQSLRRVRWPTVRGTTVLATGGARHCGSDAYVPYRLAKESSPYDVPALHLPRTIIGALRRRVLTALGIALQDVTEPTARLQELRARGAETPPPKLAGAPAHPKLRESLAMLGATRADGELELIAGPASDVVLVDARGATHPLTLALDLPVRAIVRIGSATEQQITTELGTATVRLLRALGGSLDTLPSFVRDQARRLVCQAALRRMLAPGDDAALVFQAKDGTMWSLAKLVALGTVRRTRDPGTWPVPNPNAPILVLTDHEATALEGMLTTQDVTDELRVAERGLERRAAPPLEKVELSADIRAQCIFTFPVAESDLRGEVGVLLPSAGGSRGLTVCTTGRPVATISDGNYWPLVAIVDVDGIATSRGFDALEDRAEAGRLHKRIRALMAAQALPKLDAPRDAVGVMRLPMPFLAKPEGAHAGKDFVPCLGVFWLTPQWPEAPTIVVEASGHVDPSRTPRLPSDQSAHHRVMPISGHLWVYGSAIDVDDAMNPVMRLVFGRLAALANRVEANGATKDEAAAYAWDMRLLGARTDADPEKELAKDRPDATLMRVVARRAPHLIDRATGPRGAPPPPVQTFIAAPEDVLVPVAGEEPPPVAPELTAEPEAERPSIFGGLVRWVEELITPAREPIAVTALTRALGDALTAMKLSGDPVRSVVETARGRPVRYEPGNARVLVNAKHPSVVALADHPSRGLFLLAAAVSEINRELVAVTDAEELAVIVDLLRDG